jgi:hypothetical protein
MKTIWRITRIIGLAVLGLAFILLMVRDYAVLDPPTLLPPGEPPYGHNTPGILSRTVIITLIELGLLYCILRPWSFDRSVGRVVATIVLFLPWLTLNVLISMHAGGVFIWHLLWLMAVNLILVGLLVGIGISALFGLLARERG